MDTHKKEGEPAEKAESDSIPQRKVTQFCPDHDGKELELYCEACGELACLKCILKSGKHHGHDCELLNDAFKKCEEDIRLSLEPMEKQVAVVTKVLEELSARSTGVSHQQAAIEADICTTIRKLRKVLLETLEVRETELIDQLDLIAQGKLKGLAAERDQVETTLVQLNSCLYFMKESLKTSSKGEPELLKMKATILEQVKELTTLSRPDINIEADMTFTGVSNSDVTAMCKNYGKVDVFDLSKCEVAGEGLVTATVGLKTTVTLCTVNCAGIPFERPLESVLVTERTGATERCGVTRIPGDNCRYEINYRPTTKGRHQLHIKVKGWHITGSPFSVTVRSGLFSYTAPLLTICGVSKPRRIAINHKGEIVVIEGRCISVFSPGGEKLQSFGNYGSGQAQFKTPLGVAVDGDGNILVTDGEKNNNCIQKFTAEGQFITAAGTKSRSRHPLHFNYPYGIAFNASNSKLYVSDCIQVLNSDLTFSSTFGEPGTDKGQFYTPRGITCDSTGNVYISDCGNSRIQVFSADGVFLRVLKNPVQELSWPASIAVDSVSGVAYVSEVNGCCIAMFSKDGQFFSSFGTPGQGPVEFSKPIGLAVDTSGVLYVCAFANDRVVMF